MAIESLPEELIARAKACAAHSYSPYSGFPVGAAVLWADGTVTAGCNVENAAWSPSVCAERNAIHHGVALGARSIVKVVVYTPTSTPVAPCGVCLQTICEFGPNAEILTVCDGAGSRSGNLAAFLPHSFGPHSLPSTP